MTSIGALRWITAMTMIAFGIEQVLKPDLWLPYIPNWLTRLVPVSDGLVMRLHGLINISLGLWFLVGWWLSASSWLTLIWWISIMPFAWYRHWRVGLRDAVIIVGILVVISYS